MNIAARIERIQHSLIYELSLAILAVGSVLALIYEYIGSPNPEQVSFIHRADLVVAIIFLIDFTTGISISRTRKQYFKENWLNLVSSIPITDTLYRALRILRIFRTLRIMRTLSVISNTQRIKTAVKDVSER